MKPTSRYYLAAYEAVHGVRLPAKIDLGGTEAQRLTAAESFRRDSERYEQGWRRVRYELREQERRHRARRETGVALAVVAVCIAVAVVSLLTGWGF